MKISTIMVCRNSAPTIAGSVASFLVQDHPYKELIVVDGASTDDTLKVLAEFESPEVKVESGPDRGIYDAMNKGLARFGGDAFGFLNADDRYFDRFALSKIADALGEADLVTGHLNFVSKHGTPPARVWQADVYRRGAFRRGWAPAHPTTYASRSVYERVGPFETSFKIAGDYDWLLRALEIEGVSHATIDATLVDMALGGVSTAGWRTPFDNARETLRARQMRLGVGAIDSALILGLCRKLAQLRPRIGTAR